VTYSIVARNPETGEFGVAVQSKYFGVGIVTWARPGVGAVATQAQVQVSYGPLGIELMGFGLGARATLDALLAADSRREHRQVAMVDSAGQVAVHTGGNCIAHAGHSTGDGYSTQANIMLHPTVWDAMAMAYEATAGSLAERLFAALVAAEGEGGDARGRQSAALLVVPAEGKAWERLIDLRVDDHPDPLGELRRLIDLQEAYARHGRAMGRFMRGETDALAELEAAMAGAPDDVNLTFPYAAALVAAGRADEARAVLESIVEMEPGWREMPRRLHAAGVLPLDPGLIESLLP